MNDGEAAILLVGLFFGAVLSAGLVLVVVKGRSRRLRLLELALQHPALDDQTKRELMAELARPGMVGRIFRGIFRGIFHGRLLAGLGWIGVFIGLGCLVSGDLDAEQAGPIIALISFGVLTLPFALRELDVRRHAPEPRPPR